MGPLEADTKRDATSADNIQPDSPNVEAEQKPMVDTGAAALL